MKSHKGGEKSQVNYKSNPRAMERTHKFREKFGKRVEIFGELREREIEPILWHKSQGSVFQIGWKNYSSKRGPYRPYDLLCGHIFQGFVAAHNPRQNTARKEGFSWPYTRISRGFLLAVPYSLYSTTVQPVLARFPRQRRGNCFQQVTFGLFLLFSEFLSHICKLKFYPAL